MADDYAIFKNEFRPVHFAYLEQKNSMSTFSVPRGGCSLLKKNGLQQHYRIQHAEARFVPKLEEAAHVRMKKLHGRETRNIFEKLFENRSRQVTF